MYRNRIIAVLAALVAVPAWAEEPAAPLSSLAKMPVKEVTVFKDGHAFLLHQGTMPTDASGNVLLDNLPTPVLGTFWPYSADKKATLKSVTAGRRRVKVERTALTLRELIEANPGAEVVVTETTQKTYPATIVKFLVRTAEEVEATSPPGPAEHLPVKSNLVLLKTIDGTKAVPIENIKDVKFVGAYQTKVTDEEYRNLLTLHLDWGGKPPEKNVEVGMAYLQKGIRWIPQYRVEIDGKGKAAVKLQATLLNEMTDLSDAMLHLVVGVPSFYFKETTDPIALNQVLAQLSTYFQTDVSTGNFMNNAMATQVARTGEVRHAMPGGGGGPPNLGPEIDGGGKTEDMFIYPVKSVTLKRGQRMVVPVTQTTLAYKDVFVLTVPFGPPPEMVHHVNDVRAQEIQKMMLAPKVQHNLRLTNGNEQPLTTAPATILKEGRLLAQGMMTYTGRGGVTDLQVTTAVDIKVKKTDKETKRTPNAAEFEGNRYWRVDASGTISLTNYRGAPVEVEIVRYVLGNVGNAGDEGHTEMVNALEDDAYMPAAVRPPWWHYYAWPSWWYHFNGIGKITWTRTIEPGKTVDLSYTWNYYWR